ncbi:MAG: excinuclease ABC subunit C [Ignavibacteriae bacterium]|nr:excinuclease ABC subunit C [Ignavibacteriota bacterium]
MDLTDKIANLPQKPGIYQYKDSAGKIIYVGKAIKLRNRVRSYFNKLKHHDAKTRALVNKIEDVEVIVTDSEAEALILEDTLIKKHKPRYNINLKDDKSYPYVKVTNEPYPRIFQTRNVIRDGSKYFGPFTKVGDMHRVLELIHKLFRLRTCKLNITAETILEKKHKVCLEYHIKKCDGPCEGLISQEDYNKNIDYAKSILSGKTRDLEHYLRKKMEQLSEEMKFEEAAQVRDQLGAIRQFVSRQKVVTADLVDRDVFGIYREDNTACSLVFTVREGKLIGRKHFIIKKADDLTDEEIVQRTLDTWYSEQEFVPKEIFLPTEPEDIETLSTILAKKRKASVSIKIPKIGEKRHLVDLAENNAQYILKEYLLAIAKREQSVPHAVQALQRDLRLKRLPRIIECFDNSHLQGTELVSSMVCFEDGKPKKSEYRKFKNQTVNKNDDFAAMSEAVERRYSRLINEKQRLPDLIVIDGGKGQLSSAVSVLKELGILDKVAIVGLAKRLEEVFFPGNSEAVLLPRTSSSLRLIQQLRDEAHRFAITYHRQLRSKRTFKTELTEIPGIGAKTAQKLLIDMGSVEAISKSTVAQLKVHIGEKQAKAIHKYFADKEEEKLDNTSTEAQS